MTDGTGAGAVALAVALAVILAVALAVILTVILTTGAAVGTGVGGTVVGTTVVGTGVAVGVATGVAGCEVHPASRIPMNRIARTTRNFFMHLFLLFRYISIFNYPAGYSRQELNRRQGLP
jgi:hypothetical protein